MTINFVAWFGQIVGAISLCAALYVGLLPDVPRKYAVVFYIIGAVMLLTNLDPVFSERVVHSARLVGTSIVFGLELFMINRIRRRYLWETGRETIIERYP